MSPTARSAAEMTGPLAPDSSVRSRSKKRRAAAVGRIGGLGHGRTVAPQAATPVARTATAPGNGKKLAGGMASSFEDSGPRGDRSSNPARGGSWGETNSLPRRCDATIVKPVHEICPTVLADMCHHLQRWTSASSTPSLAVADTGSFSAAARSLHTVQSNVSTHVARLERELGVTLVDRATGEPHRGGRGGRRPRPPHPGASSTRSAPTWPRCTTRSPAACASACIGTTGPVAGAAAARAPCTERHPKVHVVVVDATTTSLVPQLAERQPRPRRRQPARRPTPSSPASRSSTRTAMLVAPLGHPLARPRARRPWPTSPSTRCCSSRRAPRSATTLDAAGRRGRARRCGPRPRSTACACSPRSPSRASAPPIAAGQRGARLARRRLEAASPIDGLDGRIGRHRPAPHGPALGAGPGRARRDPRGRGRRGAGAARHPRRDRRRRRHRRPDRPRAGAAAAAAGRRPA